MYAVRLRDRCVVIIDGVPHRYRAAYLLVPRRLLFLLEEPRLLLRLKSCRLLSSKFGILLPHRLLSEASLALPVVCEDPLCFVMSLGHR